MKKLLFLLVALFATTGQSAMIDVVQSCVRISTDEGAGAKSYGSGGIVGADEDSYIIVTCEHVAHKDRANIEIVRFGQAVKTITGKVVGRDSDSDCAFIRIAKKDLGDVHPGLLPIDACYELKPGDTLWGASYPEGGALTVFEMEYIGIEGGWIKARPSIKQGRSGGIVVDADGTRVIGITWGTDKEYCYIVPAKRFSKAVGKELTGFKKEEKLDFSIADKAIFNFDFRAGKGKKGKERQPIAPPKRRPKRGKPVPPVPPMPIPEPRDIQPSGKEMHSIMECQYCPDGNCPFAQQPEPVKRKPSKDVQPASPLPIKETKKDNTLVEPQAPAEIIAPASIRAPEPIPVTTIQDPRIDEIKQTLFGLSTAQSGIDKKVDDTLSKLSTLIDDKKEAVKESLEQFRDSTLAELDARTLKIQNDIDARIQGVEAKLETLQDTNAQIADLRQAIDNFSVFPKDFAPWAGILFGVLVIVIFYFCKKFGGTHNG